MRSDRMRTAMVPFCLLLSCGIAFAEDEAPSSESFAGLLERAARAHGLGEGYAAAHGSSDGFGSAPGTTAHDRQVQSSYTCSSSAPSCISNNYNIALFELYWAPGTPIQGTQTWNIPWNTLYYYDSLATSPSNICNTTNWPSYLLMAPQGSASYATVAYPVLSMSQCCGCIVASDDGWDYFTVPDDLAGTTKGWNTIGRSTNQVAPLTSQSVFITVPDRIDLSVESIVADESMVNAGETVDVSGTFVNYGECMADDVVLTLYLSPDADVSGSANKEQIGQFSYLQDPVGGNPNVLGYLTWNIDDAMIPSNKTIGQYYLAVQATSSGPANSACSVIIADYDPADNWSDVIELDIGCSADTVDLAVDSNGDLSIDVAIGGTDESVEEDLPGLFVAVNNNDSDGDLQLDHRDTLTNGSTDDSERRRIDVWFDNTLASNPDPNIANGTIAVRFEDAMDADNCRIFDQYDAYVMGAGDLDDEDTPLGPPIDSFDIDLTTVANQTYYIEGTLPGSCDLEIVFITQDGAELCDDKVTVTSFRATSVLHGEIPEYDDEEELDLDDAIPWSADSGEATLATWIDTGAVTLSDGCEVLFGSVLITGSLPPITTTVGYTTTSDPTSAPQTTYTQALQNGAADTTFKLQSQVSKIKYGSTDYQVLGVLYESRPITIVAGDVSVIDSTTVDGLSYPASQIDQRTILVDVIEDSFGNVIPDSTDVDSAIDGMSTIDELTSDTIVTAGQASITTQAGSAGESLKEVVISIGEYDLVHEVDVLGIVFQNEQATPSSIDAGSNNSTFITVDVRATDGSLVADGTPIVWQTTLGSLATTGAPTGLVAEGTVTGGTASATLYTASTDINSLVIPTADLPGTARVTIQSGYARTTLDVAFTSPTGSGTATPIRLEPNERTLSGDVTVGGSLSMPGLSDDLMFDRLIDIQNHMGDTGSDCPECDVNGNDLIELDDFIQACQIGDVAVGTGQAIPYFAEVTFTVYGDPSDLVQIGVSDPTRVSLSGLDGSNQITLDAAGTATFMVHSLGTLPQDTFEIVDITAQRITRGGSVNRTTLSSEDLGNYPLSLAPVEEYSGAESFARGFLTGNAPGWEGFTGDITAGLWIIGDVRDIGWQTWKLYSDPADFDGWVFTFALVGFSDLLFPNAIGAAAATLKAVARRVSRVVPITAASKIIRNIMAAIGSELKNGATAFLSKFDDYAAFFEAMIRDKNFIRFLAGCVETAADRGPTAAATCPGGSDGIIQVVTRVMEEYGTNWSKHATQAANATTINATRKALRVVADADPTVAARIKILDDTDQQRLLTALAQCDGVLQSTASTGTKKKVHWREAGVDINELLSQVLVTNIQQTQRGSPVLGSSFVDIIEDIGALSAKGASDLNVAVRQLINRCKDPLDVMNSRGVINEIRQSARLANDTLTDSLELGRRVTDKVSVSISGKTTYRQVGEIDAIRTLTDGRKVVYDFKYTTTRWTVSLQRKLRAKAIWGDTQGHSFLLVHSETLDFDPSDVDLLEAASFGSCKVRVITNILDIPSS